MKTKIPTLTIGIPAYNEAGNIAKMIESLLRQTGEFKLAKILVICDGSSDDTYNIVKELSAKHPVIKVINGGRRMGKAARLNQLLHLNRSDYLALFDADLIFSAKSEIHQLINRFTPSTNVVSGHISPSLNLPFWGRVSEWSFRLLDIAGQLYNHGSNIHTLQGSVVILKKDFASTLRFPTGTISDQGYLYVKSIEHNKNGYKFARTTDIIFSPPSTFHDIRLLAVRTLSEDRQNLSDNCGINALSHYNIPLRYILYSVIINFLKNPLYTTLAIIMNIYLRLYPLARHASHDGAWEITTSSKQLA